MKSGFVLLFTIISFLVNAQSISDIQGQGSSTPYEGQEVTTTGIVTASFTTGGSSLPVYFIQDGIGLRSGIYVYDGENSPAVGDQIQITATAVEYFGLTELVDITEFNIISSGNALPEPVVLTTGSAGNENYESMLVRVEDALCSNPDIGFGEFELNDGTGALAVDDLIFDFPAALGISYSITAPLYYSFEAFKLLPRSAEDVEISDNLYFTAFPAVTSQTQNTITLSWETNIEAEAEIEYGLTDAYEIGILSPSGGPATNQEITLENLQPGTIYYLSITPSADDVSVNWNGVVVTESSSSGKMKVYFNHVVDWSVATEEEAVYTSFITDTIISYIDSAKHTLDIAIYDVENESIIDAINEAYNRGVTIRYISDEGTENLVLDQLLPEIPLLRGNSEGIMHNKFIIADREIADSCWVMTGSTNHTEANLGWDFNNVICIQDQSLARAYTLEFEEMWGSSTLQFNENLSRFGSEKTDNTPHHFIIGGIETELYFSPSDNVTDVIAESINQAAESIEFAVLVFTENAIGTAIQEAHEAGVEVRGIIDYVEFSGSEFSFLTNQGVDVMDYQNPDGSQWPDGPTLHHKYAILDRDLPDATVITGSHNWTASANSIHDENTLIVKSPLIANLYYQEFMARFQNWYTGIEDVKSGRPFLFPNPATTHFEIANLNPEANYIIEIFDLQGKKMKEWTATGQNRIDVSKLPDGLYLLRLAGNKEERIFKVVVNH